jgi:hypothetical protein
MMMTNIMVLVNESGKQAVLRVTNKRRVVCEVEITADEIVEGIRRFGNARAAMGEGPAPTLESIVRLPEIDYPAWHIPGYTDGGDRIFVIRHPAVGWTVCRFSQEEANNIATWLTKPVESRPKRKK